MLSLMDDVVRLSLEQYGSQIVENLLELNRLKCYPQLLKQIVSANIKSNDSQSLCFMMKSQYANFPVQKFIKNADKQNLRILFEKIDALVRHGLVAPDQRPESHIFEMLRSDFSLEFPLADPQRQLQAIEPVLPKKQTKYQQAKKFFSVSKHNQKQ